MRPQSTSRGAIQVPSLQLQNSYNDLHSVIQTITKVQILSHGGKEKAPALRDVHRRRCQPARGR